MSANSNKFLKVFQLIATYKYEFTLVACIFTYVSIFSYFLALKHYFFETYAWDLGIFAQSLYTTLHSAKLFYQTVHSFVLSDGSYFGIHYSPILFLLLPWYAVWPSSFSLLFIKTVAIGLAALPLYGLTLKAVKSKEVACVVSVLYLLYPPLQGANWFDFQPPSFLPLSVFNMQYAYAVKRWKLYTVSAFFGSIITEHAAIVIALFALFNWIKLIHLRENLGRILATTKSKDSLTVLLSLLISVSSFLVGVSIINGYRYDPAFEGYIRAYGNWKLLGEKVDPLKLPMSVIQHPVEAFEVLLYDYHVKFLYLVILFGSLGFIPFHSVYSIIALLLLMPFLFSNYRPYYAIGSHYSFYILPAIFVALAYSSERFVKNRGPLKTLLVVMMFFTVSTTPLSPISNRFIGESGIFWYPMLKTETSSSIESVHELISLVPEGASVITQNHIFPHLSNRANAYVVLLEGIYFYNLTAAQRHLNYLLDQSEFVLIDLERLDAPAEYTLVRAIKRGFNLYALGESAVLLKKGFSEKPFFEELVRYRTFAFNELVVDKDAGFEFDEGSKGKVVYLDAGREGYMISGLYTYFPSGTYNVTFSMKVEEPIATGPILSIDIVDSYKNEILASKTLFSFEFENGKWNDFSVAFSTVEKIRHRVEFRIHSLGKAKVYLGIIAANVLSKEATEDAGQIRFTAKDLKIKDAVVEDGIIVKVLGKNAGLLWSGSYAGVPPKGYKARFCLAVYPGTAPRDERIIDLDVTYNDGSVILKGVKVNGTLIDISKAWSIVEVPFALDHPVADLELRGKNASVNYRVELAFIELVPEFGEK